MEKYVDDYFQDVRPLQFFAARRSGALFNNSTRFVRHLKQDRQLASQFNIPPMPGEKQIDFGRDDIRTYGLSGLHFRRPTGAAWLVVLGGFDE